MQVAILVVFHGWGEKCFERKIPVECLGCLEGFITHDLVEDKIKGVRLTRTPWGIIPGYGDLRVAQRLTPTYHQGEGRIKNMLIKIYVLLYIKYMSDKPPP